MKRITVLCAASLLALNGCGQQTPAPSMAATPPAPAKKAPHPLTAAGAYVVSVQVNSMERTPGVESRERNLETLISRTLSGAKVPILTPESRDELADSAVASLIYGEYTWD